MIEDVISDLRRDSRVAFFPGFNRIAEDLRLISSQSKNRVVNAYYDGSNPPVVLTSFEISVDFRGRNFPIPLRMTFFHDYPHDQPYFRVILFSEKQHYKNKHECVDSSDGTVVNIPGLMNWSPSMQILQVINEIKTRFGNDLPIREGVARPLPSQNPPPPQNPPSNSSQNFGQIEIEMRRELTNRLNDVKAIMEKRIDEEKNKLITMDNQFSQGIHTAEIARDEKNREINQLTNCLNDIEGRNQKMRQFLSEHPQEVLNIDNILGIAMPKDSKPLVEMINLRARLEAYDNTVKLLENISNNISKDTAQVIVGDFFQTSTSHFQDLYQLQVLLNQYPDLRKYFV